MIEAPRYPKPEPLLHVPEYGHAVLEGSAGTGKTHALEHLVIDLLLSQGAPIGEILVVTLTEREATALRRRVRARIDELLALAETTTKLSADACWVLNSHARARLRRARIDFDSASIGTLHRLSREIVEENPFLVRALFEGETADERAFFSRAFEEVVVGGPALDAETASLLRDGLDGSECARSRLEEVLFCTARTSAVPLGAALVERLLPKLRARSERTVLESGVSDSEARLRLLVETLEGPRGRELARFLQSRYRAVLIDDFQRIEERTWQIFKTAFFEAAGHHPLRVVGDPKQAGADVSVYLQARKALVARSAVVPLRESYRATADLVEALNLIFDPDHDIPFFTGPVGHGRPLRPGRPSLRLTGADGGSRPPVVLLRAEEDEPTRALAAAIADEIRAVTGEDDRRLAFGERGFEEPLRLEDVAVLTRSDAEADEVRRALDERGVPSAFYRREGLFQSRWARELRDLLAAIESPEDATTRTRAFLTSFFALSLADLERAGSLAPGNPWIRRLYEWSSLAEGQDYGALFARILDESGVVRRELFSRGSERGLTPLKRILEILLEDAAATRPTPRELLSLLDSCIDGRALGPGAERNVFPLDTGEAVRIATLPEAKDLEPVVVFLFAFSRAPSAPVYPFRDSEDGRLAFVGDLELAPPEVRSAIDREEREADQRLLYLALTRAKGRLYLPLVPDAVAARGCYARLHDRLQDLLGVFTVEPVAGVPSESKVQLEPGSWRPPKKLVEEAGARGGGASFDAMRRRHSDRDGASGAPESFPRPRDGVRSLLPSGTVRERLRSSIPSGRSPELASPIDAEHDRDPAARYLGWELSRLLENGTERDRRAFEVLVRATLLEGNARVPLPSLPARLQRLGASEEIAASALALLEPGSPAEALIGAPGEPKPLVRDGDFLYHQRVYVAERELAELWKARRARKVERSGFEGILDALDAVLAHRPVLRGNPVRLTTEQQQAVRAALTSPLTIVSGGPGTGKSAIVVSLLRVAARLGVPPGAVVLSAPTPGAAKRMSGALRDYLEAIPEPGAIDGSLVDSFVEPRPLPQMAGASSLATAKLVVIEEAESLDLENMVGLFESVRSDAKLALLGDPGRLRALESGGFFQELIRRSSGAIRLGVDHRLERKGPGGRNLALVAGYVDEGNVSALFSESARDAGSIAQRRRAKDVRFQGVELLDSGAGEEEFLERWYREWVALPEPLARRANRLDSLDDGDARETVALLFAHFRRHRILTLTERAATRWNEKLDRGEPWKPVVVLGDDAGRALVAGEPGLSLGDVVWFERRGGLSFFARGDVASNLALAHATTLRESQDVELDRVAIVLPEPADPLLFRQLLGTALTRVRKSVTFLGRKEVLAAAIERVASPSSGIGEALDVSPAL